MMRAERDAMPGAGPGSGATATVQQAVEQFVDLHSSGQQPDLIEFAQRHPADLRPQILARCREFLAFDGLLGHQEWEPSERPQPGGRTFGDFVIQEELGRGGMGVVYLAHQRSLNRRVALKVMASGLTLSKRHVERFRREAAAAAQVRHPAIVPVHNLSEVDGTIAFAMDYIAGRNLADILDDLRLGNGEHPTSVEGTLGIAPDKGHVAECALLCAQLASALAAAHEAGVVHRDLKPRNVMIDDKRQARLLDFGLAKSLGEGSISMSGEITGTAHYMSPEQTLAKRVAVDHRADIFALGVILYELLTLKRPFDGKNLQQIVYEICFKEPVPLQKRNPKVPRDLATICLKALEKDPQNRYQTAAEFEADLQRFLGWEPIHAKPAGPLTRAAKWVRRHRTESVGATIVLLVASGVLGWQWYDAARRDHEADLLLQDAERQAAEGRFHPAIQLATQALGRRNDEAGRARLALYHEKSKSLAIQEEADIAEAARRSLKSSQAIDRGDRRLGVLLALAADEKRSSSETRSAVLDALGSGYATTTFSGHDRQVLCAEWSPDGACIATTGDDGKVLLWNAGTGALLHTFAGHSHWVTSAVFHPERALLLTASQDRTVRVWQLADGRAAAIWQHDGAVSMLRLDRRGERALTVSYGGEKGPYQAQVWNVATGERLGTTVEHAQHVMAAAISPDGAWAASWGGERGDVRLWDAGTGAERARLRGHDGRVQAIEFAPAGDLVATATKEGSVRLYSVPDGALQDEVHHSRSVDCLAFDGDGARLLTGSRDLTARLWRLQRDAAGALRARELRVFVGNTDQLLAVGFDRPGQLAVTAGKDGIVRIFDAGDHEVAIGTELMHYEIGAPVEEAAFDVEGRRVLARVGRQRALIWDFGDTRGVTTLRQPGQVPAVCFDATGDRVVTAGDDERLRLWNAHDGRQLWVTDKLGNPIRAIDVDPTGERIVLGMTDGRTAVHRLVDGATLFDLPGQRGRVTVARFVADGSRILVAGDTDESGTAGTVTLWNANDRTRVLELARDHRVIAADLAPQQPLLATVDDDEDCVRLWSVPGLTPRGELRGHGAAVTGVHFAADGRSVLTTSLDGTARIQDLDGTLRVTLRAGEPLHGAAWSRDGTRVLTCAERGGVEAQLWNVTDGSELLRFRGHHGAIGGAAFSPDAAWAVTASTDGTTCVWPTDPVAVARRLPLRPLEPIERQRHGLLDTTDRK
ncbi:MAG: serine/threonine protein kinase [Planctomycetes bacterium]|nr:serine/threonine protein kinase [Planctomycetota bacterium]